MIKTYHTKIKILILTKTDNYKKYFFLKLSKL